MMRTERNEPMPYLYVLAAIVLRLLPHPWNATPLAAMFLFSGATFRSRRDGLLVPFVALALSDYAASHFLHHSQSWFDWTKWVAFLLIGLLGWTLRDKMSAGRVAGVSLAGSMIFFVLTNFGVWTGPLYPHTIPGLGACYVAAIPFFRNTLLGDLFYAGVMFGSYHFLLQRRLTLAPVRQN